MATCRGMNRCAKKPLKPRSRWMNHTDELSTLGSERCSICLDIVTVRGKLPVCEHCYCYTCILEWSKKINQCPICKRIFRCISKISFESPRRQIRVPDISRLEDSFTETTENPLTTGDSRDYSRNIDQYDLEDSFIDDSGLVKSPVIAVRHNTPRATKKKSRNTSNNNASSTDDDDFKWYSSRRPVVKKRRRIVCSFDD